MPHWRKHIEYFWTPTGSQCVSLAATYRDDPAFRKNYDAIHPELAAFVAEAVREHVERLKK